MIDQEMEISEQEKNEGMNSNSVGDQEMAVQAQTKFEDLPLKDRLEAASKYSIFDHIKEKNWIDATDSINQWCLSQIVGVTDKQVKVHFDGWPSRWDAEYKVYGSKVAPFRRYTRGYTGQVKTTI